MTLPQSGAISLSDLRTEYGGSTPDSISEYYRAGPLVDNNTANGAVAVSPNAISLGQFHGGVNNHLTTVTIGIMVAIYQTTYYYPNFGPTTNFYDGHGFDAGADLYYYGPNVGSIADATYFDGAGVERTIDSVIHTEAGFSVFSLLGINIPDSDDTFVSIMMDSSNVYVRGVYGAFGQYVPFANGGTHWYWDDSPGPDGWNGATSGTKPFEVRL